MDASSKRPRMSCYRCSRCQLEVYRHYVQYDRRDRPICDPDCDGTKPGTCIWCEQVIVGRPMLMFEKKVHRECWQYCVAKFGYDEIVRRYTSGGWEQFREREVGEEMVREMVDEYFDKFCTGLPSDDEETVPTADGLTHQWLVSMVGKGGNEAWGKAIRKVLHNKKHASLPNITCTNELRTGDEGEPIDGGSDRSVYTEDTDECEEDASAKEMFSASRSDKARLSHRLRSAGERKEWLQAVKKSVCGDTHFDRESWADEAYRNTLVRDNRDVTADERLRQWRRNIENNTGNTIIDNSLEGRQSFVDSIIEEAVSVVQERNDDIYKPIDGNYIINHEKLWERATRKRNDKLMEGTMTVKQGGNEEANSRSDLNYVRDALRGCNPSFVDSLIEEAASNSVESSDEEYTRGAHEMRMRQELRDADERIENVFNKGWEQVRAFRAMYEQTVSCAQSNNDSGNRGSTLDTSSSARTPSGHELDPNVDDLVYESVTREKNLAISQSDLVVDEDIFEGVGTLSGTSVADNGVEHILTDDQLDELFCTALRTSDDPTRLGRLINRFKEAVATIQHDANTCKDCPRPADASENEDRQSTGSATDMFDSVLATLMGEIKELNNSILIFHNFRRPNHLLQTSVNGDLLSSPQGEVYGTGNVLIIFDYGEEPLQSDPESVYEYLANIYHDRESPRCVLHRNSSDGFDYCNNSEGNLSMDNETDVTDFGSTYRDMTSDVVSDEATSRLISPQFSTSTGLENMSIYDETLWAETQGGKSDSLKSLDGSRCLLSGEVFCTDAEAKAWAAMLSAGNSDEISSKKSYGDLAKFRKDSEEYSENLRKDEVECHIRDEKNASKSTHGDSGNAIETNKRAQAGKLTRENHAQPLHRLHSIKRINFDDSVTNMRATTSTGASSDDAFLLMRKSVSESDVSSYEMCACTCADRTSDSSCGLSGAECTTTWKEVRQIVTEAASTHLQHSVSLGAHKEPTDVYEIAIEITINRKNDQKGPRRRELGCRRSGIDILSCFPESDTSMDNISNNVNESNSELNHTTQETVINENGDSPLYSRPVTELNTAGVGSERAIEERVDSRASVKLNNILERVSKKTLTSQKSRNELCVGSSKHENGTNKSSEVNLSARRSSKELHVTVNRKHPSELSIDVDLFSSENIATSRRERRSDYLILDANSSTDDLFRTGLVDEKCNLEVSNERNHSSKQSLSEEREENQAVHPKGNDENIVQETTNKNAPSGRKSKDLFDVEDGSSGSRIVDSRITNESLLGGGETAIDKSSASKTKFEMPASETNVEGDNSCRQNIGRGTSSEEMKMSNGEKTNEAGGSKSYGLNIEHATPRKRVEGESSTQNMASNEKDVLDSGVGRVSAESSQVPEAASITLTEEDILIKLANEMEIVNQMSLQTDSETSKDKFIDFKKLAEENVFLEPLNVPRAVQTTLQAEIHYDASKHTDDVSLKPEAGLDTTEEPDTGLETVFRSIDYADSQSKAQVALKRSNLNVFREVREQDLLENTPEYDFNRDTVVETEIGCMSLCSDDDEDFEEHPATQHDSILRTSQKRSKRVAFNGAIPKKFENRHGRYLSHREVDTELMTCRRNVVRNTSSTTTTTGSDRESYKGNSTEEEQEMCMVLSTTSEYGIDHQWPSQCGSDPKIASGDTDGASVLRRIRDGSSARRVPGVCGEDYIEESRDERMANVPLAGGETLLLQTMTCNVIRTNVTNKESEGESSKKLADKEDRLKSIRDNKKNKKKNARVEENLDEICILDGDENDERFGVSESTNSVVVSPGGKKSKQKKKEKKKEGGGRRNKKSPTCVIL